MRADVRLSTLGPLLAAALLGAHGVSAGAPALAAQGAPTVPARVPRTVPMAPRWESRLELTAADQLAAHLGVGANARAGYYVRLFAGLAAGAAQSESHEWEPAARLDFAARFLLDPFAERPRGLYGGAGVSLGQRFAPDAPPARPVLVLLAGLEGRSRNGRVWATELSLGGGVRLGLVWRGARAGAR